MAERSFAGYAYRQRLSVGFYGEVYRAVGAEHREAQIVRLHDAIASVDGFEEALVEAADQLAGVEHANVQGTRAAGRGDDGELAVLVDARPEPVTVEELGAVTATAAYAIARGVLAGLAHLHDRGLHHGGVHPRNVAVDRDGGVRLINVAAARALARAAADADDPALLDARGYLAPELALGDDPSAATDVFAAGALVTHLLHGAGHEPPAQVTACLQRAVATDAADRFADGRELRHAFAAALAAAGVEHATQPELARLAGAEVPDELDAATEGVLASLAEPSDPIDAVVADLESEQDEDSETATLPSDPAADSATTDVDDDDPTKVDPNQAVADPVSAIIRADGIIAQGSETTSEDKSGSGLRRFVRLGSEGDDEDTYLPPPIAPPPDSGDHPVIPRRRPRTPAVTLGPATDPSAPAAPPASTSSWLWALTAVLALGGLVLVAYTQTDLFHPERRKQREEQARREHEARQAALDAQRVKPGTIHIDSDPGEAAVWLALGRTPVDTMALPAAVPHQIRIEHEGFAPADVTVGAAQWTGSGASMRAAVRAELALAKPGARPPAAPPAPAELSTGKSGRGVIRIDSDPPGAQAYLLVGFTPNVQLGGVQAGKAYELKVAKDGYSPGFVVIRAEDWRDGTSVSGSAELTPVQ